MYNNISPSYLSSLIPQQVDAISQYHLRNSNDLQTIRAKTRLYYNSFLPSILRQWNNLFIETRQLNSLNSFKCFLKEDKCTVPKYYFYGVRKAQILHTRLRMGCSSLNLDLFMKNITDTPMCQFGSIENSQHFFFQCSFYQRQRTILLNSVAIYHTPTLNLLLNGNPSLSKAINEGIFKHVHPWIYTWL